MLSKETVFHCIRSGDYNVVHNDWNQKWLNTDAIEEQFKCKYVGEFSRKRTSGWQDYPMSLFYCQEKHPKGSNYLGIINPTGNEILKCDGVTAVNHTWKGVIDTFSKTVLYSAFRNDYQYFNPMPSGLQLHPFLAAKGFDLGLTADGGPEYTRASLHACVDFKIEEDKLVVLKHTITWEDIRNDGP